MTLDSKMFNDEGANFARHKGFEPTVKIPQTDVQKAIEKVQSNLDTLTSTVTTLAANDFLVKTASGSLSAERVVTDTATIAVDWATAGQAKFNVVDDSISDAKLRNSAAVSVIGRSANSAGDPADIAAAGNDTLLRRVSDAVGFGQLTVGMFPDAVVTFAKMQNADALSVLGRSANSSGVMDEIAAATDNQVMRRSGTSIGFGAVNLASSDAVTGDLPFANLAQGTALSVLGVTGNATADNASIVAANDHEVLRRNGTAVAFGTVATNGITNDAVTFAKMQNITSDRLLGRDTASSGDPEEISLDSTLEFTGSASIRRAALTGAIVASAGSNATTSTGEIVISIDGGGAVIATGVKAAADFHAEFAFTITGWTIFGDTSGAIVIDVWKDTYANYPPTVADTIAGSEKPTITASGVKGQDTSLSTWTTSVSAGDVLRFNVDSVTSITAASLILKVTKTS